MLDSESCKLINVEVENYNVILVLCFLASLIFSYNCNLFCLSSKSKLRESQNNKRSYDKQWREKTRETHRRHHTAASPLHRKSHVQWDGGKKAGRQPAGSSASKHNDYFHQHKLIHSTKLCGASPVNNALLEASPPWPLEMQLWSQDRLSFLVSQCFCIFFSFQNTHISCLQLISQYLSDIYYVCE